MSQGTLSATPKDPPSRTAASRRESFKIRSVFAIIASAIG